LGKRALPVQMNHWMGCPAAGPDQNFHPQNGENPA